MSPALVTQQTYGRHRQERRGAAARIAQEGDLYPIEQLKKGGGPAHDAAAQEEDIERAAAATIERRRGQAQRRRLLHDVIIAPQPAAPPHSLHHRLGARHIRACTD